MMSHSVLATDQFGDKSIDESVQRRATNTSDDELRQSGLHIGVELLVQSIPPGSDQISGIKVWTTPTDRGRQLRWQLTVGDGQ